MVQLIAVLILSNSPTTQSELLGSSSKTYFQSIEPVFRAKCLPCHAKGRSAPFSLATYEEVKKNSALVRIKALSGTMPPNIGESDFGPLCKTVKLTDKEVVDLQQWIQQGMVRGEGTDRPVAPNVDWHLGKPTVTYSVAPSSAVRKEGTRYWIMTIVNPVRGGDLRAFDVVPEDRQALQQVTLAYFPPGIRKGGPKTWESAGSVTQMGASLIGVWAPGYRSWVLPRHVGLRIPKGSTLIVQAHYQPLGRAASSKMKVGLYFSSSLIANQAKWISMSKEKFDIPAYESPTFSLGTTLARRCMVIAILPEARFYCSRIRLDARQASKSVRLFETMAWNPYWVGNFAPMAPIDLAHQTKLEATFNYNNDENCSINEDKLPTLVKSGTGLSDEICKMHILVAPI